MKNINTLIGEAVINFFFGPFIGIAKALTIHSDCASVTLRDVVGVILRVLLVASLFVELPKLVLVAIFAGLTLSFITKVFYVMGCLMMAKEPK